MSTDLGHGAGGPARARSAAALAGLLFIVLLLRGGVWTMPNAVLSFLISLSPYQNPYPNYLEGQYLAWNYLGPFLSHLLGFNEFWQFFLLHLGFSFAASCLFYRLATHRLPSAEARMALLAYAAFPVSSTAYFWVGMDGLIHLLMLVGFALPGRWFWGLPVGFLLGMQHFESGLVGYGALALSGLIARRVGEPEPVPTAWLLGLLLGLLAGRFGLLLWFHGHGFSVDGGRPDWMQSHLGDLLFQPLRQPHLVFWGVFCGGWLLVWKLIVVLTPGARWSVLVPLAGLLGLVFLVADTTRVLAHATFPLLFVHFLSSPTRLQAVRAIGGRDLAIAALVLPVFWVIGGNAETSTLHYGFDWLSHALTGSPPIPSRWWDWPFR